MKVNREDAVQAALLLEHWCKEHHSEGRACDCPFYVGAYTQCRTCLFIPKMWRLEEFLRTRGIKQ